MRLIFTQFAFLKRAVSWSEAGLIAPWVLGIYLLLALAGGTNPTPLGTASAVGVILFILGSWMNSYAEYARHMWKQLPENRGRLYQLGLFRYSRHPNYLGDLISFSGLCLIAGRWITIVVPLIMLGGFVFANIPMLDAHLHDHYGRQIWTPIPAGTGQSTTDSQAVQGGQPETAAPGEYLVGAVVSRQVWTPVSAGGEPAEHSQTLRARQEPPGNLWRFIAEEAQ